MFDVVVIGAGVVGAMVARELSKYELEVCVLEKDSDVAMGATRANSAIIHAGFDAESGTKKAELNVRGSQMMESIASELGVKYIKNGSIVVGYTDEDKAAIEALYSRGVKNGVKDLEIVEGDKIFSIEPNISRDAIICLYAKTGAITCPYELTIACVGNAMDNGAMLKLNFEVAVIENYGCAYRIVSTAGETVCGKYVINCAGVFSGYISKLVGDESFEILPRKGEYILLDKFNDEFIRHTVFNPPTKEGKGILMSPTVDKNILLGPTASLAANFDDNETSLDGMAFIKRHASKNFENIPYNKMITSFCGVRSSLKNSSDFIIEKSRVAKNFINVAGIDSPGLSASPAIAEDVAKILVTLGLSLNIKKNFNPTREAYHRFKEMTIEEKNEVVKRDKRYGKIICRCEGITEGEIVRAIHMNPPAKTVDAVKRRTRSGMGRCQGGFCMAYVVEILARELGIDALDIRKSSKDSVINVSKTK